MTAATGPRFTEDAALALPAEIVALLPEQGSIEIQHDGPGKTFTWHAHSVDEQLTVLDGAMTLFWVDPSGDYRERPCAPAHRVELPAGTVHGSVAGPAGCVYVIRPMGPAPRTEFLQEDAWPFPPPASAAAR